MARRINLREYQENVFARLRSVAAEGSTSLAKLGVLIGDRACLVDMRDVSEVVPIPKMLEVPLVKKWFSGVANVRGNLYGVTDVQAFIGQGKVNISNVSRLLLVHPRLMHNSALLVSGMMGLRYIDQMQALPPRQDAPPWVLGDYQSNDGCQWQEISVGTLVQHAEYLKVGVYDL